MIVLSSCYFFSIMCPISSVIYSLCNAGPQSTDTSLGVLVVTAPATKTAAVPRGSSETKSQHPNVSCVISSCFSIFNLSQICLCCLVLWLGVVFSIATRNGVIFERSLELGFQPLLRPRGHFVPPLLTLQNDKKSSDLSLADQWVRSWQHGIRVFQPCHDLHLFDIINTENWECCHDPNFCNSHQIGTEA